MISSTVAIAVFCVIWVFIELYKWVKNNKNRFKF